MIAANDVTPRHCKTTSGAIAALRFPTPKQPHNIKIKSRKSKKKLPILGEMADRLDLGALLDLFVRLLKVPLQRLPAQARGAKQSARPWRRETVGMGGG